MSEADTYALFNPKGKTGYMAYLDQTAKYKILSTIYWVIRDCAANQPDKMQLKKTGKATRSFVLIPPIIIPGSRFPVS